jgi:hypothetical protein
VIDYIKDIGALRTGVDGRIVMPLRLRTVYPSANSQSRSVTQQPLRTIAKRPAF